MKDCKTCVHDGSQSIFPSGCTGCTGFGDGEYKNYEPKKDEKDEKYFRDKFTANAVEFDSLITELFEQNGLFNRVRRRTDEGMLAECPLCGSLDIGGAHDTVSCYGCGLKITKPRPLQNAIDAWNMRKGISLDKKT